MSEELSAATGTFARTQTPRAGPLEWRTSRRERRLRRRAALCAILVAAIASATMIQSWSDNQSSHYDLIRALAGAAPRCGRSSSPASPSRR